MNLLRRTATVLSFFFLATPGDGAPVSAGRSQQPAPSASGQLTDLLSAYIRAGDPDERAALVANIHDAAVGDVEVVARALGDMQLWSSVPEKIGKITLDGGHGSAIATYHLPHDYDAQLKSPLLILFGPQRFDYNAAAHSETSRGLVIVDVDHGNARQVGAGRAGAGDLARLIIVLRKQFHLDTDRTFLMGVADGGRDAWFGALGRPDLLAGAVFLSCYPRLEYPEQTYPLFLQNLRHVSLILAWPKAGGAADTWQMATVDFRNRAMMTLAERDGLPMVAVGIPQDSLGSGADRALEETASLLKRGRRVHSKTVSHWFRYPQHGQAGWLRQTKFRGDVWSGDQLSILPAVDTDRRDYINKVVKSRLAYLGGTVDGQTITITARRCARVDVLFPQGLVDLSQPVTIYCNGKKRFEGLLKPSIKVLLEESFESWEFQHPIMARYRLIIRADPDPG